MGTSRWSSADWVSYSTTINTKSTTEIFRNLSIDPDLNPKNIVVRESRDSNENPNSTAIMVACDVTGSMGILADNLIKKGLGILFEEIYNRQPVSDPHIMIGAIGDVTYDSAPLQVSQFEADLTIAKQLEKVYIEKGGGGNSCESYDLPLYFAAQHTSIDCWEKRQKKGYIFTIGDEEPPIGLDPKHIKEFIGDDVSQFLSYEDVLQMASEMYYVYHIIIAEGYHCRYRGVDNVRDKWLPFLGQNAIVLQDYTKLSETIVSIIEVNEGKSVDEVADSWSGDTSIVVRDAIKDIEAAIEAVNDTDIVEF